MTLGVVVWIDGNHAPDARIAAPGRDQRNGAANGDPAERQIAKIKGIQKSLDRASKEICVVSRLRYARITVTGVIERM